MGVHTPNHTTGEEREREREKKGNHPPAFGTPYIVAYDVEASPTPPMTRKDFMPSFDGKHHDYTGTMTAVANVDVSALGLDDADAEAALRSHAALGEMGGGGASFSFTLRAAVNLTFVSEISSSDDDSSGASMFADYDDDDDDDANVKRQFDVDWNLTLVSRLEVSTDVLQVGSSSLRIVR